jgi:hypothetical protein
VVGQFDTSTFFLIKRFRDISRKQSTAGSFNEVDAWNTALLKPRRARHLCIVKQPVGYAYLIEFVCVLMVSLSNLGDTCTHRGLVLKTFVHYFT